MKILLFGASGRTGRHVLAEALAAGYQVTAVVRNSSRLSLKHQSLHVVVRDITCYTEVKDVVGGHDVAICALGASSPFKYDRGVVAGLQNIVNAMQEVGVSRLIYMSFAGVKDSRHQAGFLINHIAPKILATEVKGHQEREAIIVKSALQWTIVRAVTLTNGKRTGNYRTGDSIIAHRAISTISRADVAHFIVNQIEDKSYVFNKPLIMH